MPTTRQISELVETVRNRLTEGERAALSSVRDVPTKISDKTVSKAKVA